MAALGASLAAAVVLCLVLVCLLVFHIRKGSADWQKLTESSILCGSGAPGSGSPKDETHYTNDAFQNEGDPCSTGTQPAEHLGLRRPAEREPRARETHPSKDPLPPPPPPPPCPPYPEDSPPAGSPTASDRSVRPILRERKVEEGSKSVWFKEDLQPRAQEEILLTPDGEEDNQNDISPLPSPLPSPKVFIADTKPGDNAAVRFQDPGKNSDPDSQSGAKDTKIEYL